MNYYDSFLFVVKDPPNEYLTNEQELLNESFMDSPTAFDDIYQETNFGSLEFEPIKARIVKIVDSKTGERINDDYRKIIFPDMNFKPKLGSRYKFNNNIWIVYSTNNIKSIHSSCYIRRCNNTINLQDKYGRIHEEPCVVDLKPTKSGITETEYMSIPLARQTIEFQVNEWTKPLFINSRIMFNRQVYKIGEVVEMNRTETLNPNSISYAKFYVDNDLKNEFDNEELQVADYKHYDYSIRLPKEFNAKINSIGLIKAQTMLNNEIIDEPILWYSSNPNIVHIDELTGQYHCLDFGKVVITAKLKNNTEYSSTTDFISTEVTTEIYDNIILPKNVYIPLGATENYEVYETLNGIKTDTEFKIQTSGMSRRFYDFDIVGNKFTITNKMQNEQQLLKVECINLRDNSKISINIELGGLF